MVQDSAYFCRNISSIIGVFVQALYGTSFLADKLASVNAFWLLPGLTTSTQACQPGKTKGPLHQLYLS